MNSGQGSMGKEFFDLVKTIGESKSKQEEDRIVLQELAKLKRQMNDSKSNPKKRREFLIRLLYVEMLGHDASFGYIRAVELTASQTLLEKRVGYLIASLCFSPEHEFRLMLVNRLQQDLQSTNILEICAALIAATKLATADMAPALLPIAENLLSHEQAIVRKKTVSLLHRFYQLKPDAVTNMQDHFRRALCDKDPSVMGASLHVFHDMCAETPGIFKDLTSSFVSILKQISEHRLPRDFDYHRLPAPWLQMRLLRILAILGHGDQNSSEQMYEVLLEVMRRADAGINIGFAVVYECVRTVTSIYPNQTLLDAAASSIGRFIGHQNHNLKYLGVTALGSIVKDHPKYAADHQLTVIDCLQDPDETLKRRTLELLYQMVNPVNVQVIVDKLVEHLRQSTDSYMRTDLVTRISQAAERFAPSNSWYINTMASVFELGGDLVKPETADNLVRLIAEGAGNDDEEEDTELRIEAVETFLELVEKPQLPDALLHTLFWVLGEYGYLAESTTVIEVTRAVARLTDRPALSGLTRSYGISALTKLAAQLGYVLPEVSAVINKFARSRDVEIAQACSEFIKLASQINIARQVLPVDASCEDIDVDEKLSFLDAFVQNALSAGAKPYTQPTDETQTLGLLNKQQDKSSLRFDAYEAPDTQNVGPEMDFSAPVETEQQMTEEAPSQLNFENVSGPWGAAGYMGNQASQQQQETDHVLEAGSKRPWDADLNFSAASSTDRTNTVETESNETTNYTQSAPETEPSTDVRAPAAPPAPRELTEKEKLAASLFGGVSSNPSTGGSARERARLRRTRQTTEGSKRSSVASNGSNELDILGLTGSDNKATQPASSATSSTADNILDFQTSQPASSNTVSTSDNILDFADFGGGSATMTSKADVEHASLPPRIAVSLGLSSCSKLPSTGGILLAEDGNVRVSHQKFYSQDKLYIVFYVGSNNRTIQNANVSVGALPFLSPTFESSDGVNAQSSSATIQTIQPNGIVPVVISMTLQNTPGSGSVSGRVEYDGTSLRFNLPISVLDVLRPEVIDTTTFGSIWQQPQMSAQNSGNARSSLSPQAFMQVCKDRLHLHPVEMIAQTAEAIAAARLMGTSQVVLIHSRFQAASVSVTIKTSDMGFTNAIVEGITGAIETL